MDFEENLTTSGTGPDEHILGTRVQNVPCSAGRQNAQGIAIELGREGPVLSAVANLVPEPLESDRLRLELHVPEPSWNQEIELVLRAEHEAWILVVITIPILGPPCRTGARVTHAADLRVGRRRGGRGYLCRRRALGFDEDPVVRACGGSEQCQEPNSRQSNEPGPRRDGSLRRWLHRSSAVAIRDAPGAEVDHPLVVGDRLIVWVDDAQTAAPPLRREDGIVRGR
jgi:hypothetical protein